MLRLLIEGITSSLYSSIRSITEKRVEYKFPLSLAVQHHHGEGKIILLKLHSLTVIVHPHFPCTKLESILCILMHFIMYMLLCDVKCEIV